MIANEQCQKKPGDNFILSGPYGEFVYEEQEKKIGLIAGGIGITPFIGILRYLTDKGLDTDATLVYSNKSLRTTAFRDELAALSQENKNIKVVYTMTDDPSYEGSRGRIDRKLIREHVPDVKERSWYVAGPHVLVQNMNRMLRNELQVRSTKLEVFTGY